MLLLSLAACFDRADRLEWLGVGLVPTGPAACPPAPPPARAALRVPVRVVLAPDADARAAAADTRAAAAWWAQYGVTLTLAGVERAAVPDVLLGGDGPALDREPADLPPDEAEARPPPPPSRRCAAGWRAAATTTSSSSSSIGWSARPRPRRAARRRRRPDRRAGRARQRRPGRGPAPYLGDGYPVSAFVSRREVARLGDAGRWVVAHELGHALGLAHRDAPNNLMQPVPGVLAAARAGAGRAADGQGQVRSSGSAPRRRNRLMASPMHPLASESSAMCPSPS
ncbi:MAG: matrixin family metalloprotease [Myxococcota bacterium]